MSTFEIKNRIADKCPAHNILMVKIKSLYKDDILNVQELARLTDIEYYRMRRLLFDENGSTWTAYEWFKVVVVCGCDGALPQLYKTTARNLSDYQKSKKYRSKLPKKPGPSRGWKRRQRIREKESINMLTDLSYEDKSYEDKSTVNLSE